MNVIGICMHRKQHFVAFAVNKMLCEILCYLECQLIIQLPVVIGVKRDRHLVREYRVRLVLAITFSVKFSSNKNVISKVVPVAAERGVQIITGLNNSFTALFRLHT